MRTVLLLAAAAFALVLLAVAGDRGDPSTGDVTDGRVRGPRGDAGAAAPVRPAGPADYPLPRAAVRVSSGSELRAALAIRERRSIVLASGTYDGEEPFLNPHGHHLYGARPGKAVLRAGLSLGGNDGSGGGRVRGLTVDVDDPGRTVQGAAIAVWGTGRHSQILDTTLRGNNALAAGVAAHRPDGLVLRRLVVRDFTDFGVFVDANEPGRPRLRERFLVEDVDVAGVGRPMPGSSNGTAESCVWIGDAGSVRRVRARDCAWAGLWTGTAARGANFEAIDVDRTRTGVYIEHFTHDSVFRRLRVGPNVRVGLTAEWADPDWDGLPASVGNLIEYSRFDSSVVGAYLDEGTTRTTIRRSTFANQTWAAIGDYRGVDNAYYANDYDGIDAGAEPVRRDHLSSFGER
jgi:hypothetical protein